MDDAARLESFELFDHFTAPQLKTLVTALATLTLADGELLFREAEAGCDLFVVEEGGIEISRASPCGRFRLARLHTGEIFGETNFLDRSRRSADAHAAGPTRLLVLQEAGLTAALASDQRLELAIHWLFWKSLSQKLRRSNELLTRFFPAPYLDRPVAPGGGAPTAEVHVGMESKRGLFQEQKLSSLEINFLASLCKEERYEAGQTIFLEGAAGDKLFVVLEGRVRISKSIPGAGEEALAFLERGDYFGEMALIDDDVRSADARAHDGPVVVLAMSRDVVSGLLDIHKLSSLRLLKILCSLVAKRLRAIDEKLVGWYVLAGGSASLPDLRD